tara:strand:+ start:754 stop:993 length:240 start_codon:yes stop_codon:yes gene_type:complete
VNSSDEIDPDDLQPMSLECQLHAFTHSLWSLISRFQGQEFELPDCGIIYAMEDIKARMLEEMDLGTEMLEHDSDNEVED